MQAAKALTQLHKIKRFISAPPKIKLHLYKALVRPILEYPAPLLVNSAKSSIHKLQLVQNKALRFIYNVKWNDFTTTDSLHKRANILTIQDRLKQLNNKFNNDDNT